MRIPFFSKAPEPPPLMWGYVSHSFVGIENDRLIYTVVFHKGTRIATRVVYLKAFGDRERPEGKLVPWFKAMAAELDKTQP